MSAHDVPPWVSLTPGEYIIWRDRPSVYAAVDRFVISVLGCLCGALLMIFHGGVWIPIGLFLFLIAVGYAAVVYFSQQRVQFVLTSSEIYRKSGSVTAVPLEHVRNTRIHQPFYQRLLGYGTVRIETGTEDSDLLLDGITDPDRVAWGITTQLDPFDDENEGIEERG